MYERAFSTESPSKNSPRLAEIIAPLKKTKKPIKNDFICFEFIKSLLGW
ncbi:hypothetical protein FKV91_09640 [Clostridium acetobutylicum]|uniref:Uncharacterized protein n=1 Tax=Clostridium acetobutylicum (strain ATCC 824 / DSM 792 / JCM 1419 / IAM 19013 / LMG 5710 / NBRC 13948 / NRRL B-527 / VKM B-1787 / 2291 / W) TaxID=272562 RepID=Q97CZ8_CLOAB|nr:Hypothetical protein CA_C3691 [Clostridium acetobutylicum ATCC 824]AWV80713.1 hypothetical protein DK921_11500 [Clostridium acetobutylicum]PSM05302.1 hypothetical protein C7T89_11500 [Clostridium sp. NJ4]TQD48752.1 hypothetical protein FKV91_09640 [Clostridium acetobutylicum]